MSDAGERRASGGAPARARARAARPRRVHVLRVEEEARAFAPLMIAAGAQGLAVGWLELRDPQPVPEALRAVLTAGGARAVAIGDGWSLAARPRRGPARLADVLRQQFLGCALVLVRGAVEAPRLAVAGDGRWRLETSAGARELATDALLAALRRPHPFDDAAAAGG